MSDFEYNAPPADGSPAPSGEATVEIAIGGKTYSVPKELADGVNSERANMAPSPSPAAPEAPQQVHNEDEFWADPQKYINDQISNGMKQQQEAQKAQQAGAKAEKKFWKDFYGKNPHLKQIDSYIEHLAATNISQLKAFNGDTTKIANYIADLGNKEMHKFGKTPETSQVFVEGSAQPTTAVPQPPSQGNHNATIRDVLNKRRKRRTNARLGT